MLLYHVKWTNHYWVGWLHKGSIIQNGDDDYSVSVSPSVRSLQGTTHHLTVHSVKQEGKYQCIVFTIKDGSVHVVDQQAHQVTITKGTQLICGCASLLQEIVKYRLCWILHLNFSHNIKLLNIYFAYYCIFQN